MSESFYLTLPSHSSKNEFSNNISNHFKIRLPEPVRLQGSGWKVAMASISLPDPKNVLPIWMSGSKALFYISWYHAWKDNLNTKKFLSATFKVSDVADVVDMNNMTGVNFMKTAVEWLNKQLVEKNMVPGYLTGYTTIDGQTKEHIQHDFHTIYKFEGEDLVIDNSGIVYHDFGQVYNKSPSFTVHMDLALEMGWFKRKDPPPADPRDAFELGPNLMMELRGNSLPTEADLRYQWDKNGKPVQGQVTDSYWYLQRQSNGELSKYIKMSLGVNWRFINLNHSFKNVLGPSSRSLLVYSDAGGSSVVGNQVTDLLREVDYKREGRGSYYFEPTHLQYIPVGKEVLDIIEVHVSKRTGELVKFGQGNTIVTLHFTRS